MDAAIRTNDRENQEPPSFADLLPDLSNLSEVQQITYKSILQVILGTWSKNCITLNNGQYIAANNKKRFISLNFEPRGTMWLQIKEDGNTRTVFNGFIESFSDFIKIGYLTNIHPFYGKSEPI